MGKERIEHRVRNPDGSKLLEAVRRSYSQFLRLPLTIIGGFLLLTFAMIVLDRTRLAALQPFRNFMVEHVFGDAKATGDLLSAIAGSLITVTSITFSLLLLAVQQAAGSLTHQVIDQFIRRRMNQAFFGFFIGLTLFALITLATVETSFNPVFAATLVLCLSAVALISILILIYSTIDQMRPTVIIQGIHDLTIAARKRQLDLLARTRPETSDAFALDVEVTTDETGFLVAVDVERIIKATIDMNVRVEVDVLHPVGAFVGYGDIIARVGGETREAADAIGETVARSVTIEDERDLTTDSTYGIEQLRTIAWTSISTSKQNPSPGLQVIQTLRDILSRFASDNDAIERDMTSPVVYHDDTIEELFATFEQLGVASTESLQMQQFAELARTFSIMFERVPNEWQQRMDDAIVRLLPALGDHVLTTNLDHALASLAATLQRNGRLETAAALSNALNSMRAKVGQLHSRSTRSP